MTEHVEIERKGAVQTIRMNRPDKKNALTRAMYAAMATALSTGDQDPAIRCHVLFGVPGAFTAGNDLQDFLTYATGGEQGTEVYDFLLAIARSAKPIVAGVDGVAVGIGTTMHFHCDLTFASPRSVFSTPFVDLGLVPEAGSSLLGPQTLGRQQAFALLAMGEGFSAAKAKSTGLIYDVVTEEAVETSALEAAQAIAAKPPEALKIARDLMRADREEAVKRLQEEGIHFRERLQSDEARNAFMAFMSRKKSA